ncbi:MAG: hypothetical protein DMF31_06200 [Verrucomicrobia bacterium]|nr:MAG: hypothetical protein DMF31_06200 [Verrucomicrobiota bacterium]
MEAAKFYFIVFGILTIAGGIVGYVKAGSVASIVAGSITGLLLLIAAFLLPEHRAIGLATAFISRTVHSQISQDRKSHACRDDVGSKRDRDHCGHLRLDQKVIAWEEFVCGRGGGWYW